MLHPSRLPKNTHENKPHYNGFEAAQFIGTYHCLCIYSWNYTEALAILGNYAIKLIKILHQLTIKLGLLQNFDFANVDVVQRIDALAKFLDVLTNAVWNPTEKRKRFLQKKSRYNLFLHLVR